MHSGEWPYWFIHRFDDHGSFVICRSASVRPNHLFDQNINHDYFFKLPLQGAGCPIKCPDALLHAMGDFGLSRVRTEHPYAFLDGLWLKRSWGGEVRNVSLLVAIGVNEEGFREVLAVAEGSKEDKASWTAFLRHLKERGLQGVRLFVSAQLDQVSLRLNQRPRKTLGFQTPADKLQASVASTI